MGEERLSASAQAALAEYGEATREVSTAARDEEIWQAVLDGGPRSPTGRATGAFAFALAVAAGAVLVLAVNRLVLAPRAGAPVDVAKGVPLSVEPGAKYRTEADQVTLDLGRLRLQPSSRKFSVKTAQLDVEVQNAQVLVDAAQGVTVLTVESGEVVYRTAAGSFTLRAGESVTLAAPGPEALSASAGSAPIADCTVSVGRPGYEACLAGLAGGDSLSAQSALYELGLLTRDRGALTLAIGHLHAYQQRFPHGALAPEVSVALMQDLAAAGRKVEAAAEASRFLEAFAADPRAAEVKRWRDRLP